SLEKVATAVSTKGLFLDQHAVGERLVFTDWGPKQFQGVPFQLIDPQGQTVPNIVMLHGPQGYLPPKMPKSVALSVGSPIRALHMLGCIAGWGFPAIGQGSTSMVVRFTYDDGKTEDHKLVNGEQIADYVSRTDVPGSEFAFDLDGRQLRYLRIQPGRPNPIVSIELVKGTDATAPIVMAITAEMP
ncbi:MAG: glycosyl hydrolase, partial [Planctomycetia bacterium]|nr:glycosyl hydrolase [Planctomycetia bacterium]